MAIISSLDKDQASQVVKEIYEDYEKEGKKTPEWIKVMAHSPEILKEFFELFGKIMGKGKIEDMLKWKIAYFVSDTLKCPFCVDVTSKMLQKLGASEEELKNAKKTDNFSEKEQKVLEMVKEVTLKANICTPELFDELKEMFSEEELVEIVSIIGLFNYINRFNNTFCILPE